MRPNSNSNREYDFNHVSWEAPAGKQIGYIKVHSGVDPDIYKKVLWWTKLVYQDVSWVLDALRWGKETKPVKASALAEQEEQEGAQLHLTDVPQWLMNQTQPLSGFSLLVLDSQQLLQQAQAHDTLLIEHQPRMLAHRRRSRR